MLTTQQCCFAVPGKIDNQLSSCGYHNVAFAHQTNGYHWNDQTSTTSPVVVILLLDNKDEVNSNNAGMTNTNAISFPMIKNNGLFGSLECGSQNVPFDWVRDCPSIDSVMKKEMHIVPKQNNECFFLPQFATREEEEEEQQQQQQQQKLKNCLAIAHLQQQQEQEQQQQQQQQQPPSLQKLDHKEKMKNTGKNKELEQSKSMSKVQYLKSGGKKTLDKVHKQRRHRTHSIRGQIVQRLQNVKALSGDEQKPWVCPDCHNQYATFNGLQSHFRIHTEWCFKCDNCGHRFARSRDFQEHMRVHTNERPYVCRFCRKGFKQRHNLKDHERTHTREDLFICDMCGKAFVAKHNMKNHRKLHFTS